MNTYEYVAKEHGLVHRAGVYAAFMRERFGAVHEEVNCRCGYAGEWAERFKAGTEYDYADKQSEAVLNRVDVQGQVETSREVVKRFGSNSSMGQLAADFISKQGR